MAVRGKAGEREKFCFSVLQWNAGGLSSSKFAEIKKIVEEEDVDVLVVQEANITENKMKFFTLKDFAVYGLFKSRQIASGIFVAVRNKLTSSFKIVKEMNDQDTAEIVEINVWRDNSHFKIYGIYNPPNNNNLNLDRLIINRNTIIVGDFNAASPNWGYNYQNRVGQIIEDFVDNNALFVLYDKNDPKTFIHYSGSSTNPDLIMVSANILDQCKKSVIGDPGSGHRMIKTLISTKLNHTKGPTKILWNFRKANWKNFSNDLENHFNNLDLDNDATPHYKASIFTSALLQSAKKNIPRGRMKLYKPFWNDDLTKQRDIRDRARQEAEKVEGKTQIERRLDVTSWRRENAIMKRQILRAKRETWNNSLNKMDYRKDGKKAYKLMNKLNNKRTQMANHPLIIGNKEVKKSSLIAKKLNDFYLNRYSISQQQKKTERKQYRTKSNGRDNSGALFMKDYSIEELNQAIKAIQTGKQPGPDQVFPEFVIHLGKSARTFLLSIYNMFWNRNISLPSDWVKATVIPILKPGKPREDMESYRPISLTSVLAKTFERMLSARLKFHLESKELIGEEQAGFRSNMSTTNAIMKIVHQVKSGFNLKRSSLAVFVDFQGAYDTIWRGKLLHKLKTYGIGGNMLNWIRRFLAQRWVKTRWNEADSQFRQSKVGLPQGAVSSSSFFNIYTNDLISKLKGIQGIKVSMFADDVVIWTDAENIRKYQDQKRSLENTMNKALAILQTWSKENNMIINKNKTIYQFFSLRKVNMDFELVIENEMLRKSDSTKYLGVVLDNKLSFTDHVKATQEKVENRINIMKRLAGAKWGSTQETLNKTYNIFVKPIIKYGSEALVSASKGKIEILEKAQNKALRVITGAVKTTPIAAMQKYTSNPPISYEIKKQAVGAYIKMLASQRAEWLKDHQPSSLKTQISPVEVCQNILEELNARIPMENNKRPINPLDYLEIENRLTVNDSGKKDIPEAILRAESLCMINEQYPEDEWTRVYTDGSRIQESAGAGVHSKLFSLSVPVGRYKSNYDAEIYAIYLALDNLKTMMDMYSKVVILVDSISAIQTITENHCSETIVVSEIKKALKLLSNMGKTVVLQWIPSHVGIDGNEQADSLAKNGTSIQHDNSQVTPESLKRHVYDKFKVMNTSDMAEKSKGKIWENIQDCWKTHGPKPRKEAVASFRLQTGHDCLAEHLSRIGILSTNVCPICSTGIMNSAHLLTCNGLDRDSRRIEDIGKLYWDARDSMNNL